MLAQRTQPSRGGDDVKARVSEQADFLRGFVQAAPYLSEAQVAQQRSIWARYGRRSTARRTCRLSWRRDRIKQTAAVIWKSAAMACGGLWAMQSIATTAGSRQVRMEQLGRKNAHPGGPVWSRRYCRCAPWNWW